MDVFGNTHADLTASIVAIYTCPERSAAGADSGVTDARTSAQDRNTQTVITSIVVTNYAGAGAQTFSLFLTPATDTVMDDMYAIALTHSMGAAETYIMAHGLVLTAGNTLWASTLAIDEMSILINHIEVS
jgi:hypothetical protein